MLVSSTWNGAWARAGARAAQRSGSSARRARNIGKEAGVAGLYRLSQILHNLALSEFTPRTNLIGRKRAPFRVQAPIASLAPFLPRRRSARPPLSVAARRAARQHRTHGDRRDRGSANVALAACGGRARAPRIRQLRRVELRPAPHGHAGGD